MSSTVLNKETIINFAGSYNKSQLDDCTVYELIDSPTLDKVRAKINNSVSSVTEQFTLKSNRKCINFLSYRYLKKLKHEELQELQSLNVKPYNLYLYLLNSLMNLDLRTVEEFYLLDPSKSKLEVYFEWLNQLTSISNIIFSFRDLIKTNVQVEEDLDVKLIVDLKKKLVTDHNKIKKIYRAATEDLLKLSLLNPLKLYVYESMYELKSSSPEYLFVSKKIDNTSNIDVDTLLEEVLNAMY